MARDYKGRAESSSSHKAAPGWVWFLGGMLSGLFIAGLVYLRDHSAAPGTVQVAEKPRPQVQAKPAASEEKPAPPKPQFDFYNLLPEIEVVVPDPEPEPAAKPNSVAAPVVTRTAPPVETPHSGEAYLVQVGSFRRQAEADRLRARLALLGIEARIQRVAIDGQDAWHRVRVGPFNDLRQANEIRSRLKANQINAIVMKLKG